MIFLPKRWIYIIARKFYDLHHTKEILDLSRGIHFNHNAKK